MDERTKQLVTAATHADFAAYMYYEEADDATETEFLNKLVKACRDFIALDPPFSDHEFVCTVRELTTEPFYFTDSTINEFGASYDHYVNLVRYPDVIHPDNYHHEYIEMVHCANPNKPPRSIWLHTGVKIDDGPPDVYVMIGYRIVDGKLQLLYDSPDDRAELLAITEPIWDAAK